MPKLSADLNNAHPTTVYEKDEYEATLIGYTEGPSKNTPTMRQITVSWKPTGPKADGITAFPPKDWVAYTGKTNEGKPVNVDKLCRYLNALGVEYLCKNCGVTSNKDFIIEKGELFAPCCASKPNIEFDPDLWVNKRAKIRLSVGKMGNSEEPINNVQRVMKLGASA